MLDAHVRARIQSLIGEIQHKSLARNGLCLYRGEHERYPVVSSGLFRACADAKDEAFKIELLEDELLEQARQYTTEADEKELLAEIQHFGGKTSLIDFTRDYLIALFFACAEDDDVDGRVVIHWPVGDTMIEPKTTNNRITFQKSVFVRPPRGFIVPDNNAEVVVVSRVLKPNIRKFLDRFHGIDAKSVYNDLHGYIRNQSVDRTEYSTDFRSRRNQSAHLSRFDVEAHVHAKRIDIRDIADQYHWHQRTLEYMEREPMRFRFQAWDEAEEEISFEALISHLSDIVELCSKWIASETRNDALARAYCTRGDAYMLSRETGAAETDFEKALSLDVTSAQAYRGRAHVKSHKNDRRGAMEDLEQALERGDELPVTLMDRAILFLTDGFIKEAIKDFTAALNGIERVSNYDWSGDVNFYRGVSHCMVKAWANADADLADARDRGVRVAASFRETFGTIEQFEEDHKLRMPTNIRTRLHLPE